MTLVTAGNPFFFNENQLLQALDPTLPADIVLR